jgi:hypothetical protein
MAKESRKNRGGGLGEERNSGGQGGLRPEVHKEENGYGCHKVTRPVTPSSRLISGIFEAGVAQKDGVSRKLCGVFGLLYMNYVGYGDVRWFPEGGRSIKDNNPSAGRERIQKEASGDL